MPVGIKRLPGVQPADGTALSPAIYTPHLETALSERFQSLKSVLGTIPPPSSSSTSSLQAELASLRTAHAALKAEYADISKKHGAAVEGREKSERYCDELKLELARAGGHLDPVKTESSTETVSSSMQAPAVLGNGNGSPVTTSDDKSEVKQESAYMQVDAVAPNGAGPSSQSVPPMNGASTPREASADIQHLLEHQSGELAALRAECLQLKRDKDEISAWVIAPTDEIIAQTPLYKALVEKFAENMVGYKTMSVRGEEAIEAANAMRDDMERFRESALVSLLSPYFAVGMVVLTGLVWHPVARTSHGARKHKTAASCQRGRHCATARAERRAPRGKRHAKGPAGGFKTISKRD